MNGRIIWCLAAILLPYLVRVEALDDFAPDDPRAAFEFAALTSEGTQNTTSTKQLKLEDIVIISRTQGTSYHAKRAEAFRQHLLSQVPPEDKLDLKMLHEQWAPYGAWSIFPILESLSKEYSNNKAWIFFCEEDTVIDVKGLVKLLGNYDSTKELFLGHAIQDPQPAIIHHFAFVEDTSAFSFPDFAAGWAVSTPLLKRLSKRLESQPLNSDFTIDIQHEVAMYIHDEGRGILLTDVNEFCTSNPGENKDCITSYNHSQTANCGDTSIDDIFFAVKTTKIYHDTRVPVVKKTLGIHAKHIVYYSETEDSSIPTENILVPNTVSGHCAKLKAIIDRSVLDPRFADKPWLVVVDDDTIMSVPRLQQLLACYDPKEAILLGERYGYAVAAGYGYEYVTGGGGMVLSRAAIVALRQSGCNCMKDDEPDDMWLGYCFRHLSIPVTHSPAFHQARPVEYVPSLLAHQTPVSFHKHYDIDPMAVYRDYLS